MSPSRRQKDFIKTVVSFDRLLAISEAVKSLEEYRNACQRDGRYREAQRAEDRLQDTKRQNEEENLQVWPCASPRHVTSACSAYLPQEHAVRGMLPQPPKSWLTHHAYKV